MSVTDIETREDGTPLRLEIVSEPLTYDARLLPDRGGTRGFRAVANHREYSYVRDLVMAETMRGNYEAARERLDRHGREMEDLAKRRKQMFHPDATVEFEQRAVSWQSGAGGYFAPPKWINEYFATVPTPERVLSDRAPKFDLPMGAQTVNIPRWTAGPDMNVVELDTGVPSVDIVDSAVQSAVATIAGNASVPLQLLEQSPVGAHLDWAVFQNMEARYGFRLEQQLITGTGAATPQGSPNNQLLGILNNPAIPTANQITYTDASPTVTELFQVSGQGGPLAQAIAAIGNQRLLPPEIWMMRTSRGVWIASGEISLPMALVNQEGPGEFAMLGYDVIPNDAIPINVNGNQDVIIACRPSDWLILESERRTGIYTEVISGSLMVRLQLRRYSAALLRQPTSVAYVTGSGMAVASGF